MELPIDRSLPYDRSLSLTLNELKRQLYFNLWLEANNDNARIPYRQFRAKDTVYQELIDAIELGKQEAYQDIADTNNVLKLELLKDAIDEDNYEVFRDLFCNIQKEGLASEISRINDIKTIKEITKSLEEVYGSMKNVINLDKINNESEDN